MTAPAPHRYIAIEGPIGVGKTSLARRLAPRLEASLVLERAEDNPFLERFTAIRARRPFRRSCTSCSSARNSLPR